MEIDLNSMNAHSNNDLPATPLGPPVEVETTHEKIDAREVPASSRRAKSSLRLKYEAETHVIERKLGDLESIRQRLGLTQRKMAQLLLVDPSAWTRWTKGEDQAPPHIYRMLQWYLALEEKYPALDVNFWLNTVAQVTEKSEQSKETAAYHARLHALERTQSYLAQQTEHFSHSISNSIAQRESSLRRLIVFMTVAATLAGCAMGFALSSFLR